MTPLPAFIILLAAICLLVLAIYLLLIRTRAIEARLSPQEKAYSRTSRYSIILGLILVASSFVWLYLAAFALITTYQAKSWQKTLGVVVKASYNLELSSIDRQHGYYVFISYQYNVEGVTYSSDDIGLTRRFEFVQSQSQAEDIVDSYPPGTEVWVFYNPLHPTQSALDPSSSGALNSAGVGLPLLAGGIYVIWRGVAHRRRQIQRSTA
jgi:hypothetical protein